MTHFKPVRTGRWWDATTESEIDAVALDHRGRVLVAECKWGEVDFRDLKRLRERAGIMSKELEHASSFAYALFSGRAPTDPALTRAIESGEVSWFGTSDLFEEESRA